MTVATVIEDALAELNVRMPATIAAGGTDATARLLLALCNREAKEQILRHDWQRLIVENSFTSLAQVQQTGALPTNFSRFLYNTTVWNSTQRKPYTGPVKSNDWQSLIVAQPSGAGTYGWWRIINGVLCITPAPAAGETLTFETISRKFCLPSAGGVPTERFASGDDEMLLDEYLMQLGIQWRFGAGTKGFDYSEMLSDYERAFERIASYDKGTSRALYPQADRTMPTAPQWSGVIPAP